MSVSILLMLLAPAIAGLAYFVSRGIARRRFYRNLPKPPHSWFWGHAKLLNQFVSKCPPNSYLHPAFAEIKLTYDLPDVFYMDLWPFGPSFIVLSSPEATAFPTTVNSMAQSDAVTAYLADNLGDGFLEAANGAVWKEVHQMMAPGLTPGAVKTYHHMIIDQAEILYNRFCSFARSNKVIDFGNELGKHPFEIVYRIIFGEGKDAQTSETKLYDDVNRLADVVSQLKGNAPEKNPIKRWQLHQQQTHLLKVIDAEMEEHIHSRFSKLQKEKVLPTRTTATCLLDRMLLAQVQSGVPPDRRLIKLILDNAKGLLAAGYATTVDTVSFATMLLFAFPETLQKLREEHDRVFDKDFDKTLQILREDPSRIKDLEYTSAVINETLRLFPIGLLLRQPPPDMKSFEINGQTYPVMKGQHFLIGSYIMHYDPELFENPSQFIPERHLPSSQATFPRNAHRPFERGLRSCIGQHLAMDQMRISLLMLARWFDFEIQGHKPAAVPLLKHTDLDTKLGDYMFQTQKFAAGTRQIHMKVQFAKRE